MIGGDGDAALEEYSLLVQVVRDHMLRREQPGHPLVLQVQREGADGDDQVTLVLGHFMSDPPGPGRVMPRRGDAPEALDASLPFLAELGPLLLQALALQVIFGEQRRRMAAPLEQEAVGRLQRMKLNCEIVARLESEQQGVCSICQESFSSGCEVYRLPCGHMFDVRCLKQWLERTRTCPNCRFMLQDIDQQYKDVVAPAWWRGAGEKEEEHKGNKCQHVGTIEGGGNLAQNRQPASQVVEVSGVEVHRHHLRHPQEVLRTQQQQHQQQQQQLLRPPSPSVQSFRISSPISPGSVPDRETFLESNGGYSFLSVDDVLEPTVANLEPVPPPDAPRRTGGAFREHLFAEETTMPRSLAASRLGELRVVGHVNRNPQRPNRLPTHEEQRHSVNFSEPSLPLPNECGEGATAAVPPCGRILVDAPLPVSQNINASENERGTSTFMSRSISRPPEESQTSRDTTLIPNVSLTRQPPQPTAVAGSARQLVQALRRQRAEEVRRVRLDNSNNNSSDGSGVDVFDDTSATRQPRRRPAVSRRHVLHALPHSSLPPPLLTPPQPSLPWISEDSQRRVSIISSGRGVQHELRLPGESHSQPSRGNRRNLERYEAIIRGQRGRRS